MTGSASLRIVRPDEQAPPTPRYPVKHRMSQPGYEWPIRFEWEREKANG